MNIEKYVTELTISSLFLMPAGRFDDGLYSSRVNNFDWEDFFNKYPLAIPRFADYLRKKYKYILIDSRTGYTDISGICTSLMPEKLVTVFTPNRQSLTGIIELIRTAINYRKQSDDLRPLIIFPLPSRIENAESKLQKEWRIGYPAQDIEGYQIQLEKVLKEVYNLQHCDLTTYFDEVQLQYVPRYSFGEEIAVLTERAEERLSLPRSLEIFTERLISAESPWKIVDTSESEPISRPKSPQAAKDRPLFIMSLLMANSLIAIFLALFIFLKGLPQITHSPSTASTPMATYSAACSLPTVEDNVYRQPPPSILGSFYSNAFANMDFNNPNTVQNFETIQYEALQFLTTQTERRSDFVDISLGSKYVRLTITYLSPELFQTILLNHYLFEKNGSFLNGGFDKEILSKMERIANRNEYIFLATLTASQYEQVDPSNPVVIQLPSRLLVMTNSANVQVIPQHNDQNLEERINLQSSPAYGYIYYPLAVIQNGTCELLLDMATDTRLTLSIPFIEVNGTRYETEPWLIEYAPLLKTDPTPNPNSPNFQIERNPEHFRPTKEPPVPITPENAEYWENFARFIWYVTTIGA